MEVREQVQVVILVRAVILALRLQEEMLMLLLEQLVIPEVLMVTGAQSFKILPRAMRPLGGAGRAGQLRLVPTPAPPTPTVIRTCLAATAFVPIPLETAP